MIDSTHLLKHVVRPVLRHLGLGGGRAEALVLGTAAQESKCGLWLVQLNNGPAQGIYQMEPATHDDLWNNYIQHRPQLAAKVNYYRCRWGNGLGAEEMVGNIYYATAMCRIHYLRVPEALPHDLVGQAEYWKKYWNTHLGAGTVEEYLSNWRQFAPAIWV